MSRFAFAYTIDAVVEFHIAKDTITTYIVSDQ